MNWFFAADVPWFWDEEEENKESHSGHGQSRDDEWTRPIVVDVHSCQDGSENVAYWRVWVPDAENQTFKRKETSTFQTDAINIEEIRFFTSFWFAKPVTDTSNDTWPASCLHKAPEELKMSVYIEIDENDVDQ